MGSTVRFQRPARKTAKHTSQKATTAPSRLLQSGRQQWRLSSGPSGSSFSGELDLVPNSDTIVFCESCSFIAKKYRMSASSREPLYARLRSRPPSKSCEPPLARGRCASVVSFSRRWLEGAAPALCCCLTCFATFLSAAAVWRRREGYEAHVYCELRGWRGTRDGLKKPCTRRIARHKNLGPT